MNFLIKCLCCGDRNQVGDVDKTSVRFHFHKGSPNTLDRMVVYCGSCGNKQELGISWPLEYDPDYYDDQDPRLDGETI